jgi:hypothetical protein
MTLLLGWGRLTEEGRQSDGANLGDVVTAVLDPAQRDMKISPAVAADITPRLILRKLAGVFFSYPSTQMARANPLVI